MAAGQWLSDLDNDDVLADFELGSLWKMTPVYTACAFHLEDALVVDGSRYAHIYWLVVKIIVLTSIFDHLMLQIATSIG